MKIDQMQIGNGVIDDAVLTAYIDGELDAPSRARVENYLAANPEKAGEIAHWRRQDDALRTLFGAAGAEPVPVRLDPARIAGRQMARRRNWAPIAAAAIVLLVFGAGLGWAGQNWFTPSTSPAQLLIGDAMAAHALYVKESRHAVEVPGSDKGHLVTWLSNRLNHQIDAPDLTPQGFTLVGGRLLPPDISSGAGPAAQLMYQNASANRVTVYVTGAIGNHKNSKSWKKADGLEAYYWSNAAVTCTVVGDLPKAEMQLVANQIYQQLTWRPDPPARS